MGRDYRTAKHSRDWTGPIRRTTVVAFAALCATLGPIPSASASTTDFPTTLPPLPPWSGAVALFSDGNGCLDYFYEGHAAGWWRYGYCWQINQHEPFELWVVY